VQLVVEQWAEYEILRKQWEEKPIRGLDDGIGEADSDLFAT